MKFVSLITHLLIPHESNNQKAKILHPSGLGVMALFVILFQTLVSFTPKVFPQVLGYAANISPSEVIRLTNDKRTAAGLQALSENGALSQAALAKGNDMLAKGYWAHFAPDGTSPWKFFNDFGYKYRYAGENLARDFSNPGSAVEAWMASPTHKDNILNGNYKEVGIGVVEGNLSGVDTTIIVQFFGSAASAAPVIPVARAETVATTAPQITRMPIRTPVPTIVPTPIPTISLTPAPTPLVTPGAGQAAVTTQYLISPFNSTKSISLGVVGVLLLVLSIDLIIVRRKRIMRIGGRTLAHIAFFGMILAVLLILKAGQII